MDRETRSGWLLWLLAATIVATWIIGPIYVSRIVERSEQRDCETLRADITAVESAGQLTTAGDAVTQARRVRYAQIPCEPMLPEATYKVIDPAPTPSR